jgi:hypothetical protein
VLLHSLWDVMPIDLSSSILTAFVLGLPPSHPSLQHLAMIFLLVGIFAISFAGFAGPPRKAGAPLQGPETTSLQEVPESQLPSESADVVMVDEPVFTQSGELSHFKVHALDVYHMLPAQSPTTPVDGSGSSGAELDVSGFSRSAASSWAAAPAQASEFDRLVAEAREQSCRRRAVVDGAGQAARPDWLMPAISDPYNQEGCVDPEATWRELALRRALGPTCTSVLIVKQPWLSFIGPNLLIGPDSLSSLAHRSVILSHFFCALCHKNWCFAQVKRQSAQKKSCENFVFV